jgi:hypothetical protein
MAIGQWDLIGVDSSCPGPAISPMITSCINYKLSYWAASTPKRAPRGQAPRLSDRREAEALAAHANSNPCSGYASRAGIDRLLGAIC